MKELALKILQQETDGFEAQSRLRDDVIDAMIRFKNESEQLTIPAVSISLRDRIEEALAKYWYDTEYNLIDKQDHTKAEESRKAFRKWIDDNLDLFTKQ